MSKKYKIIVATHKRFQMPDDKDLYVPVQVGSEGKENLCYQRDDQGNHISHLNPYYSSLSKNSVHIFSRRILLVGRIFLFESSQFSPYR